MTTVTLEAQERAMNFTCASTVRLIVCTAIVDISGVAKRQVAWPNTIQIVVSYPSFKPCFNN